MEQGLGGAWGRVWIMRVMIGLCAGAGALLAVALPQGHPEQCPGMGIGWTGI